MKGNDLADKMTESITGLMTSVADFAVTKSNEHFLAVVRQVLAETVASDLAPTRKLVALETLKRVAELYTNQTMDKEQN